MKSKIIAFFLIVSFILFSFSFINFYKVHKFSSTNVKNDIKYISSDEFKGRLAGTFENEEIETYISNTFKSNGLKSLNTNYFDSFQCEYPSKMAGKPYLIIEDKKGNLIKTYTYGKDYKEDMLNFAKNSVLFNSKDDIDFSNTVMQVIKGNGRFIFYVPPNNNLTFRSSFIYNAPCSMYIMLDSNVLPEIKKYIDSGYNVSCYIPYEVKQTSINNVIGYIEGKNPNAPPVVLSAHFDHVGTDLSGNIYNGALDNASGISYLMELNRYLSTIGKPNRNIYFIGFNAEEFGCLGSMHFVQKYNSMLKGAKVFNFDMIGSSSVALSVMGGESDTRNTPLVRSITSICNNQNIKLNYLFQDSSDHEAFRKYSIEAVTFCDDDLTRIHTPNDKADFISTASIDRCFKVSSKKIIASAYDNYLFIFYYKQICICSLFSTIILSAALVYIKINKNKREVK
ncbi:MAG: M28 family metallopeptidase [Bacillota bacterium]|nr:M28 family metallopeptidase [Bacillota bacterium]